MKPQSDSALTKLAWHSEPFYPGDLKLVPKLTAALVEYGHDACDGIAVHIGEVSVEAFQAIVEYLCAYGVPEFIRDITSLFVVEEAVPYYISDWVTIDETGKNDISVPDPDVCSGNEYVSLINFQRGNEIKAYIVVWRRHLKDTDSGTLTVADWSKVPASKVDF